MVCHPWRFLSSQTLLTIAGSPPTWQVSQGSSSMVAALFFITGIIRCAFNKPWSPIGILGYAQVNNGWSSSSSSVYDCLEVKRQKSESISVSKVKQHSTPQVKKIHSSGHLCQIITAETREATGCRVSTDPITIWIMGFRFIWLLAGTIHQACLRVFTHWCTVCYKHWIIECLEQLTFLGKQIHPSHRRATWFCSIGLS